MGGAVKQLRAWADRHFGVILTTVTAVVFAIMTFLGNMALDVREIKAQIGPPPHVLVDPDQSKSDHDLLIELRTDVRAIKAAVVKRSD